MAGDWYAERGAHRVSEKRQANGEKLILWTSRNEEQTKEAVEWCKKYGLIFDAVMIIFRNRGSIWRKLQKDICK